jgi:hypothetical protein
VFTQTLVTNSTYSILVYIFLSRAVDCADKVIQKIPECASPDPVESGSGLNPAVSGFKYCMSPHGAPVRSQWPVPDSASKLVNREDVSCDGCEKVRWVHFGHRERCGLWLWVCMRHGRVVGYHIMPFCEGRRDPVLSLYKFKEKAPDTIYIDYSCGAEESALNWLPEYYKNTTFYHDEFHGYNHVCSGRFKSKRNDRRVPFNTSVMEQVN